MLNLDTHLLVALFTGDVSRVFDSRGFVAWLRNLIVFPITPEIARKSTQLDFSSDPADEIIAATSVVENIPLLTRDRRIRKSKLVPLAL